eukprot:822241-Prymnesium_polylepis.1
MSGIASMLNSELNQKANSPQAPRAPPPTREAPQKPAGASRFSRQSPHPKKLCNTEPTFEMGEHPLR